MLQTSTKFWQGQPFESNSRSRNCPEEVGKIAAAGLPKLRDFDNQGHGRSNRYRYRSGAVSYLRVSRSLVRFQDSDQCHAITYSHVSSAENTSVVHCLVPDVQLKLLLHMYDSNRKDHKFDLKKANKH
jgi:hypothetical protein